jgi:hypothetical protein
MKRLLAALLFAVAIAAPAISAAQVDEYDDSQSHPLQIVAYFMYPIGFAAKWLVAWPIHYMVAQPGLEEVFGHRPHGEYAIDDDQL